MDYQILAVNEHVEVFDENGTFLFSADTHSEALHELNKNKAA